MIQSAEKAITDEHKPALLKTNFCPPFKPPYPAQNIYHYIILLFRIYIK